MRNFESAQLKVNDSDGNPIEIAAVVVWKVVDTAEACFEVDDYENYVKVQSEAAVRNLATRYPYDAHDEAPGVAARQHGRGRQGPEDGDPGPAGEGRRRGRSRRASATWPTRRRSPRPCCSGSRPGAIIAARQQIVEGAVGMVEMALERLSRQKIVDLDEERKAAMVSNLLVVLCGERAAQPVVNTGTIYQ